MINNCWLYAQYRFYKDGRTGHILKKKSKYGWWNHSIYEDKNGIQWEFVPTTHRAALWVAPPLFWGYSRKIEE